MKIRYGFLFCLFLLFFSTFGALPSEAHRVLLFAYFEGKILTGEAYFSGGEAAQNVPVEVASGDVLLVRGRTDEKGAFVLPLEIVPPGGVRVTVKAGMGHQATAMVGGKSEEESSAALEKDKSSESERDFQNPGISSEEMRQIVKQELAPLKEMLFSLQKNQEEPGIPEVMGGIGYIFGLVGMYMWYRGGRKRG